MVMVLYRWWCLNSPRPLLRRLRPGHVASLNVWRSDTCPSDPVFVGPQSGPRCRGACVGEGGFVLICVTSHARVCPRVPPLRGFVLLAPLPRYSPYPLWPGPYR